MHHTSLELCCEVALIRQSFMGCTLVVVSSALAEFGTESATNFLSGLQKLSIELYKIASEISASSIGRRPCDWIYVTILSISDAVSGFDDGT